MAAKKKTKKKNPVWSKKRKGGLVQKPVKSYKWNWLVSPVKVSSPAAVEKYENAMIRWAKLNKVRINRWGKSNGRLVAYLTRLTGPVPKVAGGVAISRRVGLKSAKLILIGRPTTKKARKGAVKAPKQAQRKRRKVNEHNVTKVSKATACYKGTNRIRKGYFKGHKGNGYTNGAYYKSA